MRELGAFTPAKTGVQTGHPSSVGVSDELTSCVGGHILPPLCMSSFQDNISQTYISLTKTASCLSCTPFISGTSYSSHKELPYLRRLVTDLPPLGVTFARRSAQVGFVADEVALGQGFLLSTITTAAQHSRTICGTGSEPVSGPNRHRHSLSPLQQ